MRALSFFAVLAVTAALAPAAATTEGIPGTAVVPRHDSAEPAEVASWSLTESGVLASASGAAASGLFYLTTSATEFVAVAEPTGFGMLTLAGDDVALHNETTKTVRFVETATAETTDVTYAGKFLAAIPGETVLASAPGEAANTFVLTRYGLGPDPVTVATLTCANIDGWRDTDATAMAIVCPSATDPAVDEIRVVTWAGANTLLASVPRVNNAYLQLSSSTVAWRYVTPDQPYVTSIATVPRDGSAPAEYRELEMNGQFGLAGNHVAWYEYPAGLMHVAPVDADAAELTPFEATGLYSTDVYGGGGDFVVKLNAGAGESGFSRFAAGDGALTHWADDPLSAATPWRVDLDAGRLLYADDSAYPSPTFARKVSYAGGVTSVGTETVAGTTDWEPGALAVSGSRVARVVDPDNSSPQVVVTDGGVELRRVNVNEDLSDIRLSGRRLLLTYDGDSGSYARLVDVTTGGVLALPYGAVLWGRYVAYVDSSHRIVRRDLDAPLSSTNPRVLRSGAPASCPTCVATPLGTLLAIQADDVFWSIEGDVPGDFDSQVAHVTPTSLTRKTIFVNQVLWAAIGPAGLVTAQFYGSFAALSLALHKLDGSASTDLMPSAFLVAPAADDRYVGWAGADDAVRVARSPYASPRAARLLSTVAPGAFSPNGDGVQETWPVLFDADTPLSAWTLSIRNSAGSVVAKRTGTAPLGAVRTAWNGRADATNARVPDGTYTWTLTGTGADGDGPLRRSDGTTAAISGTVGVRVAKPVVTVKAPATAAEVSTSTSFGVSWSTTSPGVRSYDVSYQQTVKDASGHWVLGPVTPWLTATSAKSATFGSGGKPVVPAQGATYRFLVRARDDAGNVGGWYRGTTAVPYDDRSSAAAYAGTWSAPSASGRYLSTLRYATAAGARMRVTTDMRSFRLVGDRCATCGAFRVYVDGVLVATVDSYSSSTKTRQVLWSKTLGSSIARHSVLVVVIGTSGRPKVALDAYGVTR